MEAVRVTGRGTKGSDAFDTKKRGPLERPSFLSSRPNHCCGVLVGSGFECVSARGGGDEGCDDEGGGDEGADGRSCTTGAAYRLPRWLPRSLWRAGRLGWRRHPRLRPVSRPHSPVRRLDALWGRAVDWRRCPLRERDASRIIWTVPLGYLTRLGATSARCCDRDIADLRQVGALRQLGALNPPVAIRQRENSLRRRRTARYSLRIMRFRKYSGVLRRPHRRWRPEAGAWHESAQRRL